MLSSASGKGHLFVGAVLLLLHLISGDSGDVLDLVRAMRHAGVGHELAGARRAITTLEPLLHAPIRIITRPGSVSSGWPLFLLLAARFENRSGTTVHAGASRLVHGRAAVHSGASTVG